MNAPDKIYILPNEMVRYYFTEERIQPTISYIRKDALLEWAKEIADNASWMSVDALLNKIESL